MLRDKKSVSNSKQCLESVNKLVRHYQSQICVSLIYIFRNLGLHCFGNLPLVMSHSLCD